MPFNFNKPYGFAKKLFLTTLSTLFLAQCLLNITPGIINDIMKRKLRKRENEMYGLGIALNRDCQDMNIFLNFVNPD